jgi:hypothetical protein
MKASGHASRKGPPPPPFPDLLEFSIGALDGGDWHEVTYREGVLRYRSGTTFRELPNRELSCPADQAQ